MTAFQAAAQQQGAMYDTQCRYLLEDAGWEVSTRPIHISTIGAEIDCTATKDGAEVWIEFKGSWRGDVPGMRRTDTTKKALLTGFLMQAAGYQVPYVVLTSHLPVIGSAGDVMVAVSIQSGAVADVICTSEIGWAKRLEKAARKP